MGFHRSSTDIKIKDKHLLTAYCQRPSGEPRYSELDLDQFLGAKKGQFSWGDRNFSKSSRDVVFKLDGNEPMLHAQLDDGEGNIQESELNLGHCIKNEDGRLCFMECF
ncbi:Cyanovirin-N family protein [Penicillium concentricum]|uniref:Cyanovirin-N family protein n=1 Tax=Penicillium concentricum TaxID=293559 RepID=A0A9W9V489_9EURO|nr:Cyanovirin-N family protein [Penicillium concentricum]KAJ5365681.1 Cyanovirin-N family protein [Penicillium concentricum]